jgi:hypothetical protein
MHVQIELGLDKMLAEDAKVGASGCCWLQLTMLMCRHLSGAGLSCEQHVC